MLHTPIKHMTDHQVIQEYRELTSFEASPVLWALSAELERRTSCPRKRLEVARSMAQSMTQPPGDAYGHFF
jgi:hypothetical protein